jgi:anti-sigma factor RsiW
MPEHINEQQLKGYRDRTLPVGELVAVDTHLGGCEHCRNALAGLAEGKSSKSVISGIDQARFRHLNYEQMDDWVEDRLEPADRELVMAHIGLCPPCARQLIAYQEYAPVMAAPVRSRMAAPTEKIQVKQSFWSFLKQPQYALGAAAVIAFFIITPLTRRSVPEQTGAILAPTSTAVESTIPAQNSPLIDQALNATELDQLPDSLRVGAKEVLSDTITRPASLKGLEGSSDRVFEYPLSEVVEETEPVLRWKSFGDSSYSVSLSDSRGLISRHGGLRDTRWTPPSALVRDRIYTWEVESAGVKHRGTFRVLGENQRRELEKIRAEHGNSHLVMGAVSEELGLLTKAQQEFQGLAKDKTQSQQAAKLLSHIEALRK